MSGIQFLTKTMYFSLLQNIQAGSGMIPPSFMFNEYLGLLPQG